MTQVLAGILNNTRLALWPTCIVAIGNLQEDYRGRFRRGEEVRTSWIEKLTYDKEKNTTSIITRNSIYITEGNLIDEYFGKDGFHDDYSGYTEISGTTMFQEMTTKNALEKVREKVIEEEALE